MSHATGQVSSQVFSLRHTYRRMMTAAGPQAPSVNRVVIVFLVASVFQGLAFACFYPVLQALLADPMDWPGVWTWLGVMALATVADLVLSWIGNGFEFGGAVADVTHDLRLRLGGQLRVMPMEALLRWRTGHLGGLLGGSIDEAVAPLGSLSQAIIRIMVVPVVIIGVTVVIDWRMALAMLVIFPMAVPIYRWKRRASAQERRDVADAHAHTESDLVEYTQGLAVLRTLSQTGARARRLQDSLAHLRRVQKAALLISLRPSLLMAGLVEIGLLVVLALGLVWVTQGTLSLAALAALLIIVMRFSEPLALFQELTQVFDLMEVALERMEGLLTVQPLPVANVAQTPTDHEITFDDVTFAYSGEDTPALHGVSFRLPVRSLTALVGPSGSGKTTVTRLIMRFADPQAGTVRIGGSDVRTMTPDDLMARLSVVFQDVYLFDDTILENIRMGRPDTDDDAVIAAARAANCHDFISRLPDGYATRVGDIGGSLSGGERQRISIARAILKDAPIVILDEPTAALDTESERAVQTAIDALVRERTVIVIAHRLSTIVGGDRILVFDAGRVVEQGDHRSLLQAGGRYAALWNAQQRAKAWHAAPAGAAD